jgi:hypothetical protein
MKCRDALGYKGELSGELFQKISDEHTDKIAEQFMMGIISRSKKPPGL